MTMYHLTIETDEKPHTDVWGNLATVTTAFKNHVPAADYDGDVTVSLAEFDGVHGNQVGKAVADITADAETVTDILKARLAARRKTDPDVPPRKSRKSADTETETDGEQDSNETAGDTDSGVNTYA